MKVLAIIVLTLVAIMFAMLSLISLGYTPK